MVWFITHLSANLKYKSPAIPHRKKTIIAVKVVNNMRRRQKFMLPAHSEHTLRLSFL